MASPRKPGTVTNRCVCGWEMTGPTEVVVAATIDHGKRIHNMIATREEVLAALAKAAATPDGPARNG